MEKVSGKLTVCKVEKSNIVIECGGSGGVSCVYGERFQHGGACGTPLCPLVFHAGITERRQAILSFFCHFHSIE